MLDQRPDVLAAIAQRRHLYVNDAKPIKEILTELTGGDPLREASIRGGDDPDVCPLGAFGRADALQLPALQEAEEQRLHPQAHFRNFVQEQRAAVSHFERSTTFAVGSREAALLVAEQLRFEKRFRQARAIDGDERAGRAVGLRVDDVRNHVLADTTLAREQNLCIARRGALRHMHDVEHLRTGCDQPA